MDKHGEEARERVHACLPIECPGRERCGLLITFVLVFKFFDSRLERFHGSASSRRRKREGEEDEVNENGDQYDGDAHIATRNNGDERYEGVVDGVIENAIK